MTFLFLTEGSSLAELAYIASDIFLPSFHPFSAVPNKVVRSVAQQHPVVLRSECWHNTAALCVGAALCFHHSGLSSLGVMQRLLSLTGGSRLENVLERGRKWLLLMQWKTVLNWSEIPFLS